MLFAEEVITARTYVFAESLSSEREWVRIERLPGLLEALKQPAAAEEEQEEHVTGNDAGNAVANEPQDGEHSVAQPPSGWQAPQRSRATVDNGQGGLQALSTPTSSPRSTSLDEHAPKADKAPLVATPRVDVTLQPANVSVRDERCPAPSSEPGDPAPRGACTAPGWRD